MRSGEVVCGLLEREETPPSMQALGSEISVGDGRLRNRKDIQPGLIKAVMVDSLSVLNWNETAVPSGARPN